MRMYLLSFLLIVAALVAGNLLGYERGVRDITCPTPEQVESRAIEGCEHAAFQVNEELRQCMWKKEQTEAKMYGWMMNAPTTCLKELAESQAEVLKAETDLLKCVEQMRYDSLPPD